jgi:hypothetical protein
MSNDILIVREGEGYRLLHGYLRLTNTLTLSDEVAVNVKGEGEVRIVRTRDGYFVGRREAPMPLYLNL